MLAEQILHSLASDNPPGIFLNEDVSYTLLSLRDPMIGFDDDVREKIIAQASLADGGLNAAIEYLESMDHRDRRPNSILKLRIALLSVNREIQRSPDHPSGKLTCILATLASLLTAFTQAPLISDGVRSFRDVNELARSLLPPLLLSDIFRATDIRPIARCLLRQRAFDFRHGEHRCSSVLSGIEALADAAKSTCGRKGPTIIMQTLLEGSLSMIGLDNPIDAAGASIELILIVLSTLQSDDLLGTLFSILDQFKLLWNLLDNKQKFACAESFQRIDTDGHLGLLEWLMTTELMLIDSILCRLCEQSNPYPRKLFETQVSGIKPSDVCLF